MGSMLRGAGMVAVAVGLFAGCGETLVIPPPPPPPPVPGPLAVVVAPNPVTITVGQTQQMVAASPLLPNAEITWQSSNQAVATVNATGLVTGVGVGAAAITANLRSGNTTAAGQATVHVVPAPAVTVDPPQAILVIGQTITATATTTTGGSVTWSSLAPDVASVDVSGKITAIRAGTATIRAALTAMPSVTADLSVNVVTTGHPMPAIMFLNQAGTGSPATLTAVRDSVDVGVNLPWHAELERVEILLGGEVMAVRSLVGTPAPATGEMVSVTIRLDTRQVRGPGGVFVPVLYNGHTAMSANYFLTGQSTPIATNAVPLTIINRDAAVGSSALQADPGVPGGVRASFTYVAFSGRVPLGSLMLLDQPCGVQTSFVIPILSGGITVTNRWDCAGVTGPRTLTAQLGATTWPSGVTGPNATPLLAPEQYATAGAPFVIRGEERFRLDR